MAEDRTMWATTMTKPRNDVAERLRRARKKEYTKGYIDGVFTILIPLIIISTVLFSLTNK